MLSVGMIGAGIIGGNHLAAVAAHPDTALCAVVDIVQQRAQSAALPYGVVAYTDYEKMLDEAKPDVAIVNLPHALHEACVMACARRGVHILLEKPMSISMESCVRMNEACEKAGVCLQVGHVQRYMPENRAARRIIELGSLGKLVMLNDLRTNNYFVPERPRWFLDREKAGGGIWMNYGAHSLDKLCYLTGSSVASISGRCTWLAPDTDVDGSAQALVYMQNNVSASISLCGYAVVPVNETMIYFAGGSLRLQTGKGLWMAAGSEYEAIDTSEYPDPFVAQWVDFVEGVAGGRVLHCSGEYGAEIVQLIESVLE